MSSSPPASRASSTFLIATTWECLPPTIVQVIQEFPLIPGETNNQVKDVQFGSPAYWNNTVYFSPDASPVLAFPVSGGCSGTPLKNRGVSRQSFPSISANGNTKGILWDIGGPQTPRL